MATRLTGRFFSLCFPRLVMRINRYVSVLIGIGVSVVVAQEYELKQIILTPIIGANYM